jgi:hypothetical protein
MSLAPSYRVNAPDVISEVIDGEAIILNFGNGCYYSLNESGKLIWECLVKGGNKNEILAHLQSCFSNAESVADDLSELILELENEKLIVPHADQSDPGAPSYDASPLDASKSTWTKPRMEKFTDLQELLLLDPIHDVDETGWPHQAS